MATKPPTRSSMALFGLDANALKSLSQGFYNESNVTPRFWRTYPMASRSPFVKFWHEGGAMEFLTKRRAFQIVWQVRVFEALVETPTKGQALQSCWQSPT